MHKTMEITQPLGAEAPLDAVCAQIDSFAASLRLSPELDEQRLVDATADMLLDVDTQGAFQRAGQQGLERVSQLLHSLNRLEEATGTSWFVYALNPAEESTAKTLHELYTIEDPALDALLDRAVGDEPLEDEDEVDLMLTIEGIVGDGTHLSDWMRGGKPVASLPWYLQRLTERPQYLAACVRSHAWSIEQLQGSIVTRDLATNYAAESQETLLANVLGISEDLNFDFEISLGQRSLRRGPQYKRIPVRQGGGIDVPYWSEAMSQFMHNVSHLGPERAELLYETCGIINFDRYTTAQLDRMCRLLDGDPELLEKLRSNDVTVVISDALYDYNGAMNGYINAVQDSETTLFFEVREDPREVLRPLMMLKHRFGVQASSLMFASHGQTGWLGFAACARRFYLGVPDKKKLFGYMGGDYDVRSLNIGAILRACMKPSAKTGLRHVLLAGCYMAARHAGTNQSLIEVLALLTEPEDNILVSGGNHETAFWRSEAGMEIWGGDELEMQLPVYSSRRVGNGFTTTISMVVPGF